MQVTQIFILGKASGRISAIKRGMSIFHILRVFSMGHEFFSKLDSTFPSFASNISVVLASFTLNFEYVVAETISYLKCALIVSKILVRPAHLYLFQTSITNLVYYQVGCITYRPPYNFVRIAFIYLFIFLTSNHFFVSTITWKWLNQIPSNLAHTCIGICTKHNNVFNIDLHWWRHLGAIL